MRMSLEHKILMVSMVGLAMQMRMNAMVLKNSLHMLNKVMRMVRVFLLLHVGGDPTTRGVICAEKVIASDWNIEKIDISLDVIGANLAKVYPLVKIGELNEFSISGENYQWIHSAKSQTITVSEQNSISIKLCVFDENKATADRNEYYTNVIIKTYEVDPNWESEQAAAQAAAQQAAAESEKAADAAAQAAADAAAQAAADTAAAEAAAQAAAQTAADAAAQAAARRSSS